MDRKNYIAGLTYGALAFGMWGILPLYWRLVDAISPYQIFGQRVVWSFLFVGIILLLKGKWPEFLSILHNRQEWKNIIGPAVFIAMNWFLYIWGVNNGYVIEASLGYYINPLILTLLGRIFFKERLTLLQKISIAFAAVGVSLKTVFYGRIPFIALALAVTFALYGLLKKKSSLNSLTGLGFETLVIGIPSLIYLIISETNGTGISGNLPWTFWILIALSGIVTAVPLLLYAEGTKRLPLNIVGFLQYLSPTIQLVLGIYVFKERFDSSSLLAISFIWAGIILFTFSQYTLLRKEKQEVGTSAG